MKVDRLVVGELQTNCYIVSSKKKNAFVVDAGGNAGGIKEFLLRHKLNARFIVNTHGHIDHIKAASEVGLPVYIHKRDVDMVSDPTKNQMVAFFGFFKPVTPERLLQEADVVELDGLSFKVIHTPGHTPGSICLLGEGILFSGDTLFKGGVGRTDIPGASFRMLQKSLKKLSCLDGDILVYPGHGPQTTIAEELQSHKTPMA